MKPGISGRFKLKKVFADQFRRIRIEDQGVLCGNTGETDHPKPEQTDHLNGWRKLPNFAGEDFQFSADFV